MGEESPAIFTCSLPKSPTVVIKGGNQRVRLTWNAITGAMGYNVYINQNGQYVLLTTLEERPAKVYSYES